MINTSDSTEENETIEAYTSDSREEYTDETFQQLWEKLAENIRDRGQEGSSMIYSAMTVRKPKLHTNFKVELAVDNKSQLEELMERRTEIHDFLRKKLNNGAIEVSFKVDKGSKQRKAYTDEEKFNKMAEKNPALLKLKKELGLDFM